MATAAKRKRIDESVAELDFSKPWKMSDVVLLVEDQRFHVHRNVLVLWSPVFEKMFTSNFSENKKREIRLPGKKAASVQTLLMMIYPPSKGEITRENWNAILELSHEYQIESIVDKCERFLVRLSLSDEEDIVSILIVAQNYKLQKVIRQCVLGSTVSSDITLKELQEHELFDQIEPGNYAQMLESILLGMENIQENSPSKESFKGIKKRGLKKIDEIAKILLKHISHKNSMDGRDVHAVAKDDSIEALLLALKLDNRAHSCPDMDNIVCPDLSVVVQLLKQLRGIIDSIIH